MMAARAIAFSFLISLLLTGDLSAQAPIITSVTPTVWSTGPIVIIGRHLSSATVTIGGARKFVTLRPRVPFINQVGDTIDIPANDTIIAVDVARNSIWPTVSQNHDIESNGGALIELTTPLGSTRGVRLLYNQPVIDSVRPVRAAPGSSVIIRGTGWLYLRASTVTLAAFVHAPDGTEVPMTITKRAGDTLTATIPFGFSKSVVSVRARLANGMVLEAASHDTFSVSGTIPMITSFTPAVWSTTALGSSSGTGTVVVVGRNLNGASLTVGGPRRSVTVRNDVPFIDPSTGDTLSLVRNDTIVAIDVSGAYVWPIGGGLNPLSQDIEADGGAQIEVKTAVGTSRAIRRLYQQPVIHSIQPLTAGPGASVVIKGTGFAYLRPASVTLTAFVNAPDGSEVPMTIAKRTLDTLTVTVPNGFDRSSMHVRARLPDGRVLEAASRDTFVVSGNSPIITSVSPQVVPALSSSAGVFGGSRAVTIIGRHLSGARVTVGGARKEMRILGMVASIAQAETTYIARNDTVLVIDVVPASVWPARFTISRDMDADGGAYIELTTAAGSVRPSRTLYREIVIDSIWPATAPAGATVTIKGSGFSRLTATAGVTLEAFVNAPDGSEVPMTIATRALDTLTVKVPYGFDQSQVHIRAKLANGLTLDGSSRETLVVGEAPVLAPLSLTATGVSSAAPASESVAAGRFRITSPSGVVTGGNVTFCSFQTDPPRFAVMFTEGVLGGITGTLRTRRPGVYAFSKDQEEGITIGLMKTDMSEGFNAQKGTLTITAWTRANLSANFRFQTEPDENEKSHTVSGSFNAVAVEMCMQN